MLVLSRRIHQEILIGENIVIRVTLIAPDRVKLGIIAPANVKIDRAEVRSREDYNAGRKPKEPKKV